MAIQINKTEKTPLVHLCGERGYFVMDGVVFPEDAFEFFHPINLYVQDYLKNPMEESILYLKLDYFNTSSSRMLLNILKSFNDALPTTKTVIEWFYEEDDDDLLEACEEFEEILPNVHFKKICFKEDESPNFEHLVQVVQG